MKKILALALVLMIGIACLTSCAQVEQEIGKIVSVAAVEAAAEELSAQGVEYEVFDAAKLAELQDEIAEALAEEYETEMQGELTAALSGEYTNESTGGWVAYNVYGFSAAADADAMEKWACDELADMIAEGKALVVNGGYIVSITVSSTAIEQ